MVAVNPRPIMLTGHSLGGALATICSLDLILSLHLEKKDILVSTFGSPRVGNFYWAELYDKILPIHWRFGLEKDLISTMPKIGYRHVGNRVLMTESGNLFLDPNSLEGVLWTGERKTSTIPFSLEFLTYLQCQICSIIGNQRTCIHLQGFVADTRTTNPIFGGIVLDKPRK